MSIQLTSNRVVGSEDRPYVIAELGSNHNGNMDLARKLIQSAKDAGADCVKFQSWSKESIFSKQKYEENYFLGDDYRDREDYTLEKIVEEYSISESELIAMKEFSHEVGIDFTSTPFSRREADFLVDQLDTPFIKVASMDLNNYPFLEYLAKKGKPMVVSTGMGTLSEIDQAVNTIESAGNKEIVILHCVSIYPPKDREINLKIMDTLSTMYPYPIGFSDHTLGTCIPLAAVARGACLIEKHFTLDKKMEGWDHKVSADFEDMLVLTRDAERIFNALGGNRVEQTEPKERIKEFRRSIVAARDISMGEIIREDMLDYKRPGGGFSPDFSSFVIGRKAQRDISFDSMIYPDDI
jgi:sialic acid synthase SpsE